MHSVVDNTGLKMTSPTNCRINIVSDLGKPIYVSSGTLDGALNSSRLVASFHRLFRQQSPGGTIEFSVGQEKFSSIPLQLKNSNDGDCYLCIIDGGPSSAFLLYQIKQLLNSAPLSTQLLGTLQVLSKIAETDELQSTMAEVIGKGDGEGDMSQDRFVAIPDDVACKEFQNSLKGFDQQYLQVVLPEFDSFRRSRVLPALSEVTEKLRSVHIELSLGLNSPPNSSLQSRLFICHIKQSSGAPAIDPLVECLFSSKREHSGPAPTADVKAAIIACINAKESSRKSNSTAAANTAEHDLPTIIHKSWQAASETVFISLLPTEPSKPNTAYLAIYLSLPQELYPFHPPATSSPNKPVLLLAHSPSLPAWMQKAWRVDEDWLREVLLLPRSTTSGDIGSSVDGDKISADQTDLSSVYARILSRMGMQPPTRSLEPMSIDLPSDHAAATSERQQASPASPLGKILWTEVQLAAMHTGPSPTKSDVQTFYSALKIRSPAKNKDSLSLEPALVAASPSPYNSATPTPTPRMSPVKRIAPVPPLALKPRNSSRSARKPSGGRSVINATTG